MKSSLDDIEGNKRVANAIARKGEEFGGLENEATARRAAVAAAKERNLDVETVAREGAKIAASVTADLKLQRAIHSGLHEGAAEATGTTQSGLDATFRSTRGF